MSVIHTTNFTADLHFSLDDEWEAIDRQLLKEAFRDCLGPVRHIWKTGTFLDKLGMDYGIRLEDGRRFTVDLKVARRGVKVFWKKPDVPNLCLEVSADVARGKPGWAVKDSLFPDFIAFGYRDLPRNLYMYSARVLREVTQAHLTEWTRKYGLMPTYTAYGDRVAESRFIPVPVNAFYEEYVKALMRTPLVFGRH